MEAFIIKAAYNKMGDAGDEAEFPDIVVYHRGKQVNGFTDGGCPSAPQVFQFYLGPEKLDKELDIGDGACNGNGDIVGDLDYFFVFLVGDQIPGGNSFVGAKDNPIPAYQPNGSCACFFNVLVFHHSQRNP